MKNWQHAYVSGNGRMGVMVYGDPANETLVGNHCRMFLPQGNPEKVPLLADSLPELTSGIDQSLTLRMPDAKVLELKLSGGKSEKRHLTWD